MRRVLNVMVAMMSMSAWAEPVITTPEVIASSACPACIDYQVVGFEVQRNESVRLED